MPVARGSVNVSFRVGSNAVATMRKGSVHAHDADAVAYLAAVEAADGQSLESAVRTAVTAFVVGCKADGIWSAIAASCILMGARTLSGALVPLRGPAPTNQNFVSGEYSRTLGLKGTAYNTSKLILTNYSDTLPQNDAHIAVYMTSINSLPSQQIIAATPPTSGKLTRIIGGSSYDQVSVQVRSAAGGGVENISAQAGLVGGSRTSASLLSAYMNGAAGTNTQNSAAPPAGQTFTVFGGTDARIAFYSIGTSLSLALLDARVSALRTAIGAAI